VTSKIQHLLALESQAAARMEGFTFTCLAQTDSIEAWRCGRPGISSDRFDIMATSRGVAVVGDIDGLLFNAGYSIDVLARGDAVYRFGKLEESCREMEFDRQRFIGLVVHLARDALEESGFSAPVDLTEASTANDFMRIRDEIMPKLVWNHADEQPTDGAAVHKELDAMRIKRVSIEAISGAIRCDSTAEAVEFMREHAGNGVVPEDWYQDVSLERPDSNLMMRLNMFGIAAKAVAGIKAMAEAQRDAGAEVAVESRTARRKP
jgi:hypothetical protein